jgi:hypothetical protein
MINEFKEVLYDGRIVKVREDKRFVRDCENQRECTCFCECCGYWVYFYSMENGDCILKTECSDLLDFDPNK